MPKQKGHTYRQAGFTHIVIIVILLILGGLVGAFYLGKQANKPLQQPPISSPSSTMPPTVLPSSITPSPTQPTNTPTLDLTANWKTFTNAQVGISFRYPSTWYFQDDSKYGGAPPGNTYSFYVNGSKADPSFGDHKGNEVFTINFSHGAYTIEELNNTYKDAVEIAIDNRPALKKSNLIIILNDRSLIHIGYSKDVQIHLDQILSTFRFIQ